MRRAHQAVTVPGAVLNVATLSALRELEALTGNKEVLANLITNFLDEAPGLLRRMREAIAQRSSEDLEKAAERLEQQAAAVGAERVAWLSREFYEDVDGGSEVRLVRFQLELDRARKCLRALLNGEMPAAA